MRKNVVIARSLNEVLKRRMEPREFCRRWFEADEEMESSRGYRARCVNLLSEITGIRAETISSKWGEGIEFEKMPEHYKITLSYADTLREMIQAAGKHQGKLLDMILERLKHSR